MVRDRDDDDDDDIKEDDDEGIDIEEIYIGDQWSDIDWDFDWDDMVGAFGEEEEFSYDVEGDQ